MIFNALKGANLPDDWPSTFLTLNWIRESNTHTLGEINIPGIQSDSNPRHLNYFDVETIWSDDDLMATLGRSIRENFRGLKYGFYAHPLPRFIDFPTWVDYWPGGEDPMAIMDMLLDFIPNMMGETGQDISQEPKVRATRRWLERIRSAGQQSFANHVDCYFPSLYAFNTYEHWLRYAVINISQLRARFPDKPIYPFIWPHLHTSFNPENTEYPYFDKILDFCLEHCDGAVIWTKSTYTYEPSHAWVQTLRGYL